MTLLCSKTLLSHTLPLSLFCSLSLNLSIQPMSSSRRLARAHKSGDASEKGPEMRSAVQNDAQHALLYGWAMQQARALRFYVSRSQLSAESSGANALNGTGASRPASRRKKSLESSLPASRRCAM